MKVVKGDLTSMKASAAQVFAAEVTDANNIIKSLDEFISQVGVGTKLTGAAYEVIKSQLEEFKALMENRMTIATNMKSAIDSALSSMENYMEGYSELDTDELEEIETPSVIEDKAEEIKTTISTPKIADTQKQVVAEVKQEVKIENNNNTPQTKEETIQTIPEAPKQEVVIEQPVIVGEEYKTNDTMINTIRNVINSNQSEDMKLYGYNIVVDSSIVDVTSQFTYTEQRVIDKIKYKFGTIRIYARDYYNNGQYICTQCYII